MTNDEYGRLIDFIGRRFDEVNAKLAEHDARFERIDTQFGEVQGQIEHLYARFERLEQEYQAPDCVVPGTFNRARRQGMQCSPLPWENNTPHHEEQTIKA